MSKWRDQAIKDVAAAMGVDADDVRFYMRRGVASSYLARYAVAQREAVLELRERLEVLLERTLM